MSIKLGGLVSSISDKKVIGLVSLIVGDIITVQNFEGRSLQFRRDQLEAYSTVSPWSLLANNQFKTYQDFGISTSVNKILNTASNTISTLKASRTLFKPYQYIPLIKFFQAGNNRILIADEVGLGKTIEAGHILLEMAGRRLLRNCLIVCPKSLRDKWQMEMQEKFFQHFKLYGSSAELINDLNQDITQHRKTIFGIVTYGLLRNNDLQEIIKKYSFDLVICDEVHKVRNHETLSHRAISHLLDYANATVFLTATPVMTGLENLYNLLRLLQPKRFSNYTVFSNVVELNRPFITALSQLNQRTSFIDIAQTLSSAIVTQRIQIGEEFTINSDNPLSELMANDELYLDVVRKLNTLASNPVSIASIQQDLINLNSLSSFYSRTRRTQVQVDGELISVRKAHPCKISLSQQEAAKLAQVDEGTGFEMVTRRRMMASCIPAYELNREALQEGFLPENIVDSKFDEFEKILYEVVTKHNQKLIVFSFFRKTLYYLNARLKKAGYRPILLHGEVADRTNVLETFRLDSSVQVLLSSEVGSEGLDLQYCNALVNYDLPWNPMVIEQRIGRIDRVGQKSPVIHIYNLVLRNTIEEVIYDRLLERIHIFERSIGDLETILGDEDSNLLNQIDDLERQLYIQEYSAEKQRDLVDQVAIAIETQILQLQTIQSELHDAILNDLYLKDEVNKVVTNRRYLDEHELLKLLFSLVRNELSAVLLHEIKEGLEYEFTLPSNETILFDFIRENLPTDQPELLTLLGEFIRKHSNTSKIRFTLNQEYSFVNRQITFIGAYHPLIIAAARFFERKGFTYNQAYQVGISQKHLEGMELPKGYYLFLYSRVTITKILGTKTPKTFSNLIPIGINLTDSNEDCLQFLPEGTSEQFWGKLIDHRTYPGEDISFDFDNELVDIIRSQATEHLQQIAEGIEKREEMIWNSQSLRQFTANQAFLKARLSRIEDLLDSDRGIKEILLKERRDLEQELANIAKEFAQRRIKKEIELLDISLIQVY